MHSTPRAKNGEPQPAPTATNGENVQNKRDLTSWWRQFKRGNPKREDEPKAAEPRGIFGVPLQDSIKYANVAISLFDEEGNSYIYGYIPIVVAKCGVFLKEKATEIEGIFRLAGSEKRIKELRESFNSPDRYGKGLDWTGYTVHDAANILRRYFNQLPEPIIPLDHYERFRNPLREYVPQTSGPDGGAQLTGDYDVDAIIRVYQHIITEIPPLNRQLLLYILDLLAVFAAKSDQNKMTTQNLAAIFQPGILNHPQHEMAPNEYRLSQAVLVFLIENQDHFIVGMQGTAADAQTIQEVQAASAQRGSTTPTRPKSGGLGRSSSNASAGAESVRRYGGVRRNVSVSSRHSRNSVAAQSPVTPSFATNMHRSNTVPSKKSPAITPGMFPKDRPSDPSTPATPPVSTPQNELVDIPRLAPPEMISPSSDESTPLASEVNAAAPVMATPEKPAVSLAPLATPARTIAFGDTEAATTPVTTPARTFTKILLRASSQEPDKRDGRKPNKLQKKRAPGSANPSAHSSTHSLTGMLADVSPPAMPHAPSHLSEPLAPPNIADALKPSMSPSASFRSHSTLTDYSEQDHGEDTPTVDAGDKDKKRRWRFSNPKRDGDKGAPGAMMQAGIEDPSVLGLQAAAKQSQSSVTSSSIGAPLSPEQTVQQQQLPTSPENNQHHHHHHGHGHGNGKDKDRDSEKKNQNPIGWFKGKIAEHKDKADKKRNRSPSGAVGQQVEAKGSRSSLHIGRPKEEGRGSRGRSMDIPRRFEAMEGVSSPSAPIATPAPAPLPMQKEGEGEK